MKKIIPILIILLTTALTASGQNTYFGKNKVQYQKFEWQFIQSRHFDIYFYDQAYETAKFSAEALEASYPVVSDQLDYRVHKRIPVFIYNSPNEFQQTNIIGQIIDEGTGGFTESAKNRIVVPFNGSYEDFRHVLHHELTHAVTYDMLLGNLFTSLLSRRRLFDLPLWFAEGFAEYSSRATWHYRTDMIVRDATINNYLAPPDFVYGGMEYYQGTAMVNYIVDNYGEERLGDILKSGKIQLTMNKAMKAAVGIEQEEFWKSFEKEMKRRYWPEISKRKEAGEIGRALTEHEKDGSYRNQKPIFAPVGNYLAIFSDRSDYPAIYLVSAIDGREIDRLIKGHVTGDIESLHSYLSGIAFSPDGKSIAFVAKSKGRDALYFLTIDDKKIFKRQRYEFSSIQSPDWSPDGTKVVMSVLDGRYRDLYIYDLTRDTTYPIMEDIYDDMDPHWFPDSKRLVFASDRPHPDNAFIRDNPDYKFAPGDSVNWWSIYNRSGHGNYNIFSFDIESGRIDPVAAGIGINREPVVSPDGARICFVSNRNGIDNLYIMELASGTPFAITDILTGVESPSWSPDGKQIAFASFNKGAMDIFILKEISSAGHNGILELTDYAKGLYYNRDISQVVALEEDPIDSAGASVKVMAMDSTVSPAGMSHADLVAENPADSAAADTLILAQGKTDSTATTADTTRIEGDEFIHISDRTEHATREDALANLFDNVSDSSRTNTLTPEEQAVFDSVAASGKLPGGEYKVYNYRVKFTPDYVSGGFSYDTFFGLRGQSIFAFSDYTGDHQIILLTDLVNTIDQSNIQAYYFYNRRKINMGVGIFHTKNYYIDTYDHLFSDRLYGAVGYLAWPFSKFFRAELEASQYFIDRDFHDSDDPRPKRSTKPTVATLGLVQDNILWGITGPINGRRSRIDLSLARDFFDSDNISYYALDFDYRKYWHIKGLFSTAFRLSGGFSWGDSPKRYFLGGTSNFLGQTVVDARVYDEENLYFADVVTPLRGFNYYELSGTRYGLMNFEFRYPFVDYLKVNFPLPMAIRYVTGAIFYDLGAAWQNDEAFRGFSTADGGHLEDIKSSFGFGIRANLGIFVLRYDLAWRTNLQTVAAHPKYYFSLGADF